MSFHHYSTHHHATNKKAPELTPVDGTGAWNHWTRNFKTPILALLDLMDNAFDAAAAAAASDGEFQGLIHVNPDIDETGIITGLAIINNSPKNIKPMEQILKIYHSSKGNSNESIGENGVGLKQACATLSNLSFALSKNLGLYSLGVLSKSLQRTDGCVFPSYTFANYPTKEAMMELFQSPQHAIVGECIADYGDESLEQGVDLLLQHYKRMLDLEDRKHVFTVVLHHLKHNAGANTIATQVQVQEEVDSSDDEGVPTENVVNYAQNALGIMSKLKQELPRQYIHVSSKLNVQVNGERIVFSYWQRRMVELSSFSIKVDPKQPITKANDDWKDPLNGYSLKVYCGFDPIRLSESSKSPASLFVYCRQMGRLILHNPDCRNLLKLVASGSDYSQGLTIIVDDYHGMLPLSPTKQDLAFGDQAHGEVHEDNLFNWLSGIAKVYYKCHLGKMEKKQKALLTAEINRHLPAVQQAQLTAVAKPLPECNLSTLINIPWCLKSDRVSYRKATYTYVTGVDTLITIREPEARQKDVTKKKKSASKKKRKASTASTTAATVKVSDHEPPRKRVAVDYSEQRDVEDDEEEQVIEEEQQLHEQELMQVQDEEISRLKRDNARLKASKKELKQQFRILLDEVKELRQENASLSEKLASSSHHHHRARLTACKSTLGSPSLMNLPSPPNAAVSINNNKKLEDELSAAKRKIKELEAALTEAEGRADSAEMKAEVQQDLAESWQKKAAELRKELRRESK